MDDLQLGIRDKRGHWRPNDALKVSPLLAFPWSLKRVLTWLPSYFLPWNALFFGLATVSWLWLTPTKETLATFSWDWVALVFLRNAAIVLVVFGLLELRLYVRRRQANRFKYNPAFPADHRSSVFMFGHQAFDSIIRTFGTGVPIWTAYEVLYLWAWANGIGPWAVFSDNPIWLVVIALMIPVIHDLHFYLIHRLIHVPVLYKWIHSVHHNSVNPSPWSSLSMHPVEHLLYWSDSLVHLILPSHPLLAIFHLQLNGVGAVVGHIGFDRIETTQDKAVQTHAQAHYLHHKYFEVNYSDGLLPLDQWFGTWHDGTSEGDRLMKERFRQIKSRRAAKHSSFPGQSE